MILERVYHRKSPYELVNSGDCGFTGGDIEEDKSVIHARKVLANAKRKLKTKE
jgi:hypothetical protein